MIVLTLAGVAPWDGVYEFPDFRFTQRELHRIKQLSGIRAGELIEALDANDTAAMVGVAVVVLARTGKAVDPDDLFDSTVGSIRLDIVADPVDEEDDADPPTRQPAGSGTESTAAGGGDGSASGGE